MMFRYFLFTLAFPFLLVAAITDTTHFLFLDLMTGYQKADNDYVINDPVKKTSSNGSAFEYYYRFHDVFLFKAGKGSINYSYSEEQQAFLSNPGYSIEKKINFDYSEAGIGIVLFETDQSFTTFDVTQMNISNMVATETRDGVTTDLPTVDSDTHYSLMFNYCEEICLSGGFNQQGYQSIWNLSLRIGKSW